MKTILSLLGYGILIVAFTGCESSVDSSSAPGQNEAPPAAVSDKPEGVGDLANQNKAPGATTAKKPNHVADGERYVSDEFALVVPRGWRNMAFLANGQIRLYLSGDGIGVPAVDETGAPLQIGMTVEKFPNRIDSLDEGVKELAIKAKRYPRLKLLGEAKIDSYRLDDGTEAVLLTWEFIKEGYRRSLQMKLLAKDSAGNDWVVSAFIVGGKESTIPRPDSSLAKKIRAYVTSFCFDPANLAGPKADEKGPRTE